MHIEDLASQLQKYSEIGMKIFLLSFRPEITMERRLQRPLTY